MQKTQSKEKSTELRKQQVKKEMKEVKKELRQRAKKSAEIKTALKSNSIAPNVLECTKMNVIDITMAYMVIGFRFALRNMF